jgi:hypothetical protein
MKVPNCRIDRHPELICGDGFATLAAYVMGGNIRLNVAPTL